ncbi:hypothetical protein C7972_12130 [Arenibacter sp. ARW7G5Y1]|nr:hypothetical protein C7972_12130 [Arenibacter sp. ARW7G5Y1]
MSILQEINFISSNFGKLFQSWKVFNLIYFFNEKGLFG